MTGRCVTIDPTYGKLFGHVVSADELVQPLADASVSADTSLVVKTAKNGYWEMLVRPGSHRLQASAKGFLDGATACSVEAGGHNQCNLHLTQKVAGLGESTTGGCGCAAGGGTSAGLGWLLLACWGLVCYNRRSPTGAAENRG
jgi:hypothetical protein